MKSRIATQDLEEVVRLCYDLKMRVVKSGCRDVLNFGHTVGHAVELLFGITHGRAVTIGMVKEAEIGETLGILDKEFVADLRSSLSIENDLGFGVLQDFSCRFDEIMEIMQLDKKNEDGKMVFSFNEEHPCVSLSVEEVTSHLSG